MDWFTWRTGSPRVHWQRCEQLVDDVTGFATVGFDRGDTLLFMEKMMKVYLASSFLNKEAARSAMNMLEDNGFTITTDWTVHEGLPELEVLKQEASEDLRGVKDADVFIMLWPGRMGSNAELGAALAYGKPCILVGGVNRFDSVYFNHDLVRLAGTVTDAIKLLRQIVLIKEYPCNGVLPKYFANWREREK